MDQPLPSTNNQAPLPNRKHHLLLVLLALIASTLYIAFNVWMYQYSKSGNAPPPGEIWKKVTKSGASFQGLTGPGPVISPSINPASKNSTPTPRSTGPGEYACAPDGTCNRYGEDARKQYCSVTFADTQCLDQCEDTAKRCSK